MVIFLYTTFTFCIVKNYMCNIEHNLLPVFDFVLPEEPINKFIPHNAPLIGSESIAVVLKLHASGRVQH